MPDAVLTEYVALSSQTTPSLNGFLSRQPVVLLIVRTGFEQDRPDAANQEPLLPGYEVEGHWFVSERRYGDSTTELLDCWERQLPSISCTSAVQNRAVSTKVYG